MKIYFPAIFLTNFQENLYAFHTFLIVQEIYVIIEINTYIIFTNTYIIFTDTSCQTNP